MKPVHVQLADKGRNVGMFEIRPSRGLAGARSYYTSIAYAKTFENSVEGDMTKLSLDWDQEMRCCML